MKSTFELCSWAWISGICKGCLGDDTILLESYTLLGQTPQKVSPIHLSFSCATDTLSQAICTLNILAGSRRHPVPRPGTPMSSYMAEIKPAFQIQLSWTNDLQRPSLPSAKRNFCSSLDSATCEYWPGCVCRAEEDNSRSLPLSQSLLTLWGVSRLHLTSLREN